MKKHYAFFVLALVMITTLLKAQQTWVSFYGSHSKEPSITIVESNPESVKILVEFPGMYRERINYEELSFDRLSLNSCVRWGQIGAPEISSLQKLIAVPECDTILITSRVSDSLILDEFYLYPRPRLVEDNNNGVPRLVESFYYEPKYYESTSFSPSLPCELDHFGYVRSQKLASIRVNPIHFNPERHQLIVSYRTLVTIRFKGHRSNVSVNTGIFDNVLSHTLLNYKSNGNSAKSRKTRNEPGQVTYYELQNPEEASQIVADYLIITDETFFHNDDLNRLANHRAKYNGYDIAIVTSQNITNLAFSPPGIYQNERRIRSFTKMVYEGHHASHTYDGKLAYLLLVGEAYFNYDLASGMQYSMDLGVPASMDRGTSTILGGNSYNWNDYYFSCITESNGNYDSEGDLFIGRLAVHNPSELFNIIDKTIYSEIMVDDDSWKYRNEVMFGGDEAQSTFYHECLLPYISDMSHLPYRTYDAHDFTTPINEGVNTFLYYGHSNKYWMGEGDLHNIEWFSENLDNTNKYPFYFANSCLAGDYAHYYPDIYKDCIGSSFTKYDSREGMVAFLGGNQLIGIGVPSSGNPSDCDESFHQRIYDKVYQAIFEHLLHITGEFILEGKLASQQTPGEYTDYYAFNLFGDPALDLYTTQFQVTKDLTLGCGNTQVSNTISNYISVNSGVTLTISGGTPNNPCDLYFDDGGIIAVQNGGKLIIGPYVVIHGKTLENLIYVEGELEGISDVPGQLHPPVKDVIFTSIDPNHPWEGFELWSPSPDGNNYKFDHCNFENCGIAGFANSINISNSSFTNSTINMSETDLELHNSTLGNSHITLQTENPNSNLAIIDNNTTFTNDQETDNDVVLKIIGYTNFNINHSAFSYNNGTGIDLINCGNLNVNTTHLIDYCTIHKTSNPQNPSWGVRAYNSYADLNYNFISNNKYGVSCLNSSNINLSNNNAALNSNNIQRIKDNYLNQVIAFDNSFPLFLHYNEIKNSLNTQSALIYYDDGTNPNPNDNILTTRNVKCNNFPTPILSSYFFPPNGYQYSNWTPGSSCSYLMDKSNNSSNDDAETILSNWKYSGASKALTEIIDNYPNSPYSLAALKYLFFCYGNSGSNYSILKEYYQNKAKLLSEKVTRNLALSLANKCDVARKDYAPAIQWFKSKIEGGSGKQDSIYALIDLDYLLLQIKRENLQKSSMMGNWAKDFTVDQNKFRDYSSFLIRKLFEDDDNLSSDITGDHNFKNGFQLFQNHPNPFKGETKISYSVPYQSHIQVVVSDMSNRKLIVLEECSQTAGIHDVTLDCITLLSGCYFLSLISNNQDVAHIKMIVLK